MSDARSFISHLTLQWNMERNSTDYGDLRDDRWLQCNRRSRPDPDYLQKISRSLLLVFDGRGPGHTHLYGLRDSLVL